MATAKLKTDLLKRQIKALASNSTKASRAKAKEEIQRERAKEVIYRMPNKEVRDNLNQKALKSSNAIIERFKKVHGNKYNYSRVGSLIKSSIISLECRVHGVFNIVSFDHVKGKHCPDCMNMRKRLLISFKRAHGDKYNYSLVEASKLSNKVQIICPVHGVFEQRAADHNRGMGCSKCGRIKSASASLLTNGQFIRKAQSVHGLRYSYRLAFYKGNNHIVIIECKEHGLFMQMAGSHLGGSNCPSCSVKVRSKKRANSLETVIDGFRLAHGDKYDYSLVEYVNNKVKVQIICPKHGIFEQRPNDHSRGNGCKTCSNLARKKNKTTKKPK